MRTSRLAFLLAIVVVLAACGGADISDPSGPTPSTEAPASGREGPDSGNDEPSDEPTTTMPPDTPTSDEDSKVIDPTTPPASTMPDGWERGNIMISEASILILESYPAQVQLSVQGDTPTPCHQPFWEVEDDGETISVDLYTGFDPTEMCTQVIQPFDIAIPLGSFTEGSRAVTLNGELVGEFDL